MSLEIKIASAEVEKTERTWEGQTRTYFNQWALLQQGGFVLSFVLSHQNEHDILKPGDYELDPTSFSSKNGRLTIDRVRLRPASDKPRQVSAPKQ